MIKVEGKGKFECRKRAVRGGARLCTAVGLTTNDLRTRGSTPDLHGDDHKFTEDRGAAI